MTERLEGIETWADLCAALRKSGFARAADWIESWVDEYMPGEENEPLPREDWS